MAERTATGGVFLHDVRGKRDFFLLTAFCFTIHGCVETSCQCAHSSDASKLDQEDSQEEDPQTSVDTELHP